MFLDRRQNKRYEVSWDAKLLVQFPEFSDQMVVTVDNISIGGALLQSKKITIQDQHLIIGDLKPELLLRIDLPDVAFESSFRIAWYRHVDEKNFFEIGIEFIDLSDANRKELLGAIKQLGAKS
ncbi:MAG: PilZ domain-containing protein [Deltaproteobacteria bacterium]|nr:PilZ domain-containing protein [Deltaproteobacteria bacterium]